jgi:hypothetical protein
MVHPVTGEHITSYRKLMNDPVTSEVWMTAFGKDFGGMCQGDNKTGTKGTDAIFVMEPHDVPHIPKDQPPTYAKVVVAYCPQKDDPHCIRITTGGNKIFYPGELTTRTADMTTAKLHWNSVLSTPNAKYMCLDIGNFYLSATLDRYEYMKMPINLFPPWIVDQYNLLQKLSAALSTSKCEKQFGDSLKPASSPTNFFENALPPTVITSASILRDFGNILPDPFRSPSSSMILGLSTNEKRMLTT